MLTILLVILVVWCSVAAIAFFASDRTKDVLKVIGWFGLAAVLALIWWSIFSAFDQDGQKAMVVVTLIAALAWWKGQGKIKNQA